MICKNFLVYPIIIGALLMCNSGIINAQNAEGNYSVNEDGVLVETSSGEEVSFFGVNYSTPFAHSYRAMKLLDYDHKKAIDEDVYHFARMGLDAFRIHIWDTEISDSLGNITPNEHLDLFDYMLAKLEERNIKVILTPLTFYDNAYPDGATPTDGFANYISKEEAPLNPDFYPVIKNYLDQFLNHENPYTGKTYREDPNIIAMEIINEPTHYGDEQAITDFINEMADHVRNTGWEKPVFYNIAQNPPVVDAVMKADVDGLTFQWYPGGLVGGETNQRNFMPYIHDYPIPFRDGEGFEGKALMVYEFDAADDLHTYSYPLMARSFREAGFQWATQFAYDPTGIAPYNSDYPTHYLNLAYTPKRALSMLIASEIFHEVPRKRSFEDYEADMTFSDFRLSHEEDLAELNAEEKFYHTNHTSSRPKSPSTLKHIAGVGNSPLINYEGHGAYFLDKIEEGVWRLEVYPDAIPVSDPFDKPNFNKEVTHIIWGEREMTVDLPGLGENFRISGINEGNEKAETANSKKFTITPGTYLLTHSSKKDFEPGDDLTIGKQGIRLNEFHAPEANTYEKTVVVHEPEQQLTAGESTVIRATILGSEEKKARVILYPYGNQGGNFELKEVAPKMYEAEIPAGYLRSGKLDYWISLGEGEDQMTFPGGHEGSPWAWNYYHDEVWSVPVIPKEIPTQAFFAERDIEKLDFAFSPWSSDYERSLEYTGDTGNAAIQVYADSLIETQGVPGWSFHIGDIIENRKGSDLNEMKIHIGGVIESSQVVKVILTNKDGIPFETTIEVGPEMQAITMSENRFISGKMALLPRPYPTFLPYWFEPTSDQSLDMNEVENIQLLLVPENNTQRINREAGFQVTGIRFN
ncbi:MAG: hypothetical protein WD357_01865 [Gracilimonas sp.]